MRLVIPAPSRPVASNRVVVKMRPDGTYKIRSDQAAYSGFATVMRTDTKQSCYRNRELPTLVRNETNSFWGLLSPFLRLDIYALALSLLNIPKQRRRHSYQSKGSTDPSHLTSRRTYNLPYRQFLYTSLPIRFSSKYVFTSKAYTIEFFDRLGEVKEILYMRKSRGRGLYARRVRRYLVR